MGRKVEKQFDNGLYKGTIESYDRETGYRVQFSDELVDYGILEVRGMLLPADQYCSGLARARAREREGCVRLSLPIFEYVLIGVRTSVRTMY